MIITMLGTSGSGKTTYMAAMGHKYFLNDVNGYKLRPANDSYQSMTYINRVLTVPANLIYNKRVFPEGTNFQISVLELNLWGKNWNNYGVPESIIDINFIDYPGGYINQLAVGNKNENNEQVLSSILLSDAIIVFVDATALKTCKDDYSLPYTIGATSILPLLERAATRQSLNIVFMITKCDSSIIDIENDIELLKNKVKKAYGSFLYFNDVSYCFIPVGAIGIGAVSTVKNYDTGTIKDVIKDDTPIRPYKIASSFAQALLFCLEKNKIILEQKKNKRAVERQKDYKMLNPDSTLLSFFRIWKDIVIDNSRIREGIVLADREIESLNMEVNRLEAHRRGLEAIARMDD